MKQSLKLGLIVVVIALLAASGLALAQNSGTDVNPDPADDTTVTIPLEERGETEHRRDLSRVRLFGKIIGGFEGVVDILGVDEGELKEALVSGSSLSEVAAANGIDEATLIAELTELAAATLQDAVADGQLEQAQADEMVDRFVTALPELVNHSFEARFGKHGRHHHAARGFIGDEVSEILGLEKREIHELLEGGQTLADIATDQGVDPESLIDDVTASFRDKFSDRVYGIDSE